MIYPYGSYANFFNFDFLIRNFGGGVVVIQFSCVVFLSADFLNKSKMDFNVILKQNWYDATYILE